MVGHSIRDDRKNGFLMPYREMMKYAEEKELAESRLSVLIGGAGTGKTTLLALLCKSPQIRDGGVLLLAPTEKARVRMSQAMKQQAVLCRQLNDNTKKLEQRY
jgi:ABC-type branched-subunit amino acid transport system ATPase component